MKYINKNNNIKFYDEEEKEEIKRNKIISEKKLKIEKDKKEREKLEYKNKIINKNNNIKENKNNINKDVNIIKIHPRDTKGVCLVRYMADWCRTCKITKPVYNEIVNQLKDRVTFIELEQKRDNQIFKENDITELPSFEIYLNGNKMKTIIGMRPKNRLIEELENILKKKNNIK